MFTFPSSCLLPFDEITRIGCISQSVLDPASESCLMCFFMKYSALCFGNRQEYRPISHSLDMISFTLSSVNSITRNCGIFCNGKSDELAFQYPIELTLLTKYHGGMDTYNKTC